MKYKIFGCKVNKYYAEKWLETSFFEGKKGVFVLSCVVTDKAKKKWVKFVIDNINNLKDDEKIYLSGCGTINKGDKMDNFFQVYKELEIYKNKIEILGEEPENLKMQREKQKGEKIVNNHNSFSIKNRNISKKSSLNSKLSVFSKGIYTKKFILIQSGCDSFCTYCLTVQKRGSHYFRGEDEIVEDILSYEKSGGKEIVLTGINIGAWGLNSTNEKKERKLSKLLKVILEKTKIPRIRISSLGVEFVDDELLEIFKNKRIYPHFHYSIQSASTKVLKSMGRHYSGENVKKLLEKTRKIKREDRVKISIGADIIVGFPGETEEDFMNSCNIVSDYKITKLHTFSFSAHNYGDSVPASKLPNQIDEKTKKIRYNKITKIADDIRNDFIKSQIGESFEVLIEKVEDGIFKGWTQNYIEVTNKNFKVISGNIKKNNIIKGILK